MKIPKKLIHISPDIEPIKYNNFGFELEGIPAKMVDIALKGKKTHLNTRTWATYYGRHGQNKIIEKEVDNVPFQKVHYIWHEYRNYDILFYVKTEEGFIYPFRQKSFLFSVMNDGLVPGGLIDGSFLWYRGGGASCFLLNEKEYTQKVIKDIVC